MIAEARRRIGRKVLEVLGRSEPASEIALSFAVGVAISFSPFLGLHWLIALLVAWAFRLNKVDVLIGTLLPVNPWTLVPVYSASTALGWYLLHSRRPGRGISRIHWNDLRVLSLESWKTFLRELKPFFSSFLLGSMIFSVIAGLITYLVVVNLIRAHRAKRALAAARAAPVPPNPNDPSASTLVEGDLPNER